MPDSVHNQGVGMFMSCLHILPQDKKMSTSCKPAILEFRSELLRTIETVMLSPFLVAGATSQKQRVSINYFSKFVDDPHNPATQMVLEVKSKFIQVYSATLVIHAEFSGLRHIMYHHP